MNARAATPKPEGRRSKTPAPTPQVLEGWRSLVTPEGVDLRLRIGSAGDRGAAFLLDIAIIVGLLVALTLAVGAAAWTAKSAQREMISVVWLLGFFLLRNFYFTAFELRPGAATPGKRALGLRVAARSGGRLTAEAVFARNAMRELEVFLPLVFLFSRGTGIDGWVIAAGLVWTGIFLLFPLFNRDRLRAGDLIAGTMVVKAPRSFLQPDLSDQGAGGLAELAFTPVQLDAYGVKELHVLEEVIRRGDRRTVAEVARRIRGKIGWPEASTVSDRAFLSAYYAGLRGRLESQLLFGRRRRDKHDRP